MNEQARIKLAEATGRVHVGDWICPNCGPLDGSRVTYAETCDTCRVPVSVEVFDPFTNASDDYAVLEWLLSERASAGTKLKASMWLERRQKGKTMLYKYRVGDYARAACEALGIDHE